MGLYSPDNGPNDNPDDPSDPDIPNGISETTHMMLRSDRTDFMWAIEEQLEPGICEFRACAKHTFGSTGYGEWVKFEVK